MASQRYTDLKKLFEDAMPESGLLKDRYTRLGKAMVDELSIPTHWGNYAACDELVGGTKRTALGIPPVIILLESKEIDSANRLDMGKRQLKRLHQGEEQTMVRPVRVVGVSVPMTTGDRGRAPKPVSTLDLLNKPLDRGHVMALEIGGPDDAENIVPQWSQWQQSGLWRYHETQVREFGEIILSAESGLPAMKKVASSVSTPLVVVNLSLEYTGSISNTRWTTPSAVDWETYVFRPVTGSGKFEAIQIHTLSLRLDAEFGDALAQKAYKEYCAEIDTGMKTE
ncbi:hypothetical protein D187_001178 [Cystobacter fuscus DSM 2262]|uniref:Uncharacterized protein n=1 Tax=Cystobacter fuscus (strain ATCC 25194 / DSM 2262 / NBRC 100088 / M29) TaxID=1242864 RepID=S9PAF5_CYSF2|nr:hypothetical protein [Cystobacter fuscus]EPX61395.1 hypothetical protein D187_001178 [Cystobacter fuscus DSM 2262]